MLDMQKALERFLLPDARQMVHELTEATGPGFRKLNDAVRPSHSLLHRHPTSHLLHSCATPLMQQCRSEL